MNKLKILIGLLIASTLVILSKPVFADITPLHVVWNKTPINVVLPVGTERMVSFPGAVSFGYDVGALPASKLGTQNNNGTLYLMAKQEFIPYRVEVKINSTGKIVLLNLSAAKGANDVPLSVVIDGNNNARTAQAPTVPSQPMDFAALTQFAVNSLYAPERLLDQPTNIYRVAMHSDRTAPLILDGTVLAMPKISWRSGDYYITAVTLRNITHYAIKLNPFGFCGDWESTSLYPLRVLLPAGTFRRGFPLDSTTAFLISKKPFANAIGVCNGGEA